MAGDCRDLLAQGNFRGRQAIIGLPAAAMLIQHLRMPKLDDAETKKALAWEARGKLPIDPSQAVLRHLTAGEVYQDQEPKHEVILMAAAREFVNQLLVAAAKAKLDCVGMNVEPKAIVDVFTQIYRRKSDEDVVNCFVDIGSVLLHRVIARPGVSTGFCEGPSYAANDTLDVMPTMTTSRGVFVPQRSRYASCGARA